jgi:hypothetical protein
MSRLPKGEEPRWLDRAENIAKLYRGLWAVCLLLLIGGEGLLRMARRSAEEHGGHHGFGFESWPGFYALFGFAAYVLLIQVAKQFRKLVKRPETYYGD